MVRSPYVAGHNGRGFYEADPSRLRRQIEASFLHTLGPGELPTIGERAERDIVACISPHAGFMYSGACAAHVYGALSRQEKPDKIVILGTNHTGIGGVSTSFEDWATPLGVARVDRESIKTLGLEVSEHAHRFEHSIEVQLPFLQYIWGDDFRFTPIMMAAAARPGGLGVEDRIAELDDVLVIASSDFTHYEHATIAKEKDFLAIDAILDLDADRFLEVVSSQQASICGYVPIVSTIIAAKKLGAKTAELLKYTTSGDITGDNSSVVAYAAIVFRK